MTTNELYQRAVENIAPGDRSGAAKHLLSNGRTLFCYVARVAGRSITRGHMRTTYHLTVAGAEYSKPISRDKAASLLKAEG